MIFLCHDNFLEWMSVNFCVSNVWDIKCELGRPMNSHVVVPVSMVPFLFTFFFLLVCIGVWVISTDRSLIELTVLILQSWSKFETCVINPSKWAIRYNIYDTIVQAQFVIADFSSRLTLNLFWKKQKKQIPTTIN